MKDWKTTAAGLLSAFLATVGPATAYFATQHDPRDTKITALLTAAGMIARAWIGLIQQDAVRPQLPEEPANQK